MQREEEQEGKREVSRKCERGRRRQAAPFIVGWPTWLLPGNCGEEHTWLLPGNCGGRVKTTYMTYGHRIMGLGPANQEPSVWEHGKQAFCPLQINLLGLNLARPESRLPFTVPQSGR